MKLFKEDEIIECLSGDTLPTIRARVTGIASLEGMSATAVLISRKAPKKAVVTKNCTLDDGAFLVQLASSDTAALDGEYWLEINISDAAGKEFKKFRMLLIVYKSP